MQRAEPEFGVHLKGMSYFEIFISKVLANNKFYLFSGGINRDWVGVPRKLYKVGSDTFRCACVNLEDLKNPDSLQYARRGHLQLYEDCDPDEASCFVEQ